MSTPQNPMSNDERLARLARLSERNAPVPQSRATNGQRPAGRNVPPTARTAQPTGRRHAAKGSRAAALALSVGTTLGLAGYMYDQQAAAESATTGVTATASGATTATTAAAASPSTAGTAATTAATTATTTAPTTAATTAATTPATAGAEQTSTANASGLADGTYVGATVTNRWGPVQVQITIDGGVITSAATLQTPYADGKSVAINNQAAPILVSETLTAQSADVNTVSGATYTSDSYRQSLQTAIDQARAAATA